MCQNCCCVLQAYSGSSGSSRSQVGWSPLVRYIISEAMHTFVHSLSISLSLEPLCYCSCPVGARQSRSVSDHSDVSLQQVMHMSVVCCLAREFTTQVYNTHDLDTHCQITTFRRAPERSSTSTKGLRTIVQLFHLFTSNPSSIQSNIARRP